MFFPAAFIAMLVDRFVPYPDWLTRAIGHPVIWQGALIGFLEKRLNLPQASPRERRDAGVVMLALLIAASLSVSAVIGLLLQSVPYAFVVEALLASTLLAHHELAKSVALVAEETGVSPERGRQAVAHIVGRDTEELDEAEISRAAIESLAENSSDGVIAPLFWFAILGLPGIIVYKAINTADSMVGHKTLRFVDFGWASAKLDDVVNWIPARLTALLYALAARFDVEKAVTRAWETAKRDAPKHASPNAGWPEAALAGALGFGLGGSRNYGGKTLDLPAMGKGKRDLGPPDIYRALRLFEVMTTIALAMVGFLALMQI
ncbi:MAG TPA: cobalamin biosynthesis protein CobD [Devosia sp.]|nr:cobalamin biosynthesis protein CobD [Devosia sp.]